MPYGYWVSFNAFFHCVHPCVHVFLRCYYFFACFLNYETFVVPQFSFRHPKLGSLSSFLNEAGYQVKANKAWDKDIYSVWNQLGVTLSCLRKQYDNSSLSGPQTRETKRM